MPKGNRHLHRSSNSLARRISRFFGSCLNACSKLGRVEGRMCQCIASPPIRVVLVAAQSPARPHHSAPSRRSAAPTAARSPATTAPDESHAVTEHRVALAGEHERTPVDAVHALPVGRQAMFQAGVGCDVLRDLGQLPIAQHSLSESKKNSNPSEGITTRLERSRVCPRPAIVQ